MPLPTRLAILASAAVLSGGPYFARSTATAAEPAQRAAAVPVRHSQAGGWQIVESQNFRFHHANQSDLAVRLAALCEKSRCAIRQRWVGDFGQQTWTIKCDVFLYSDKHDFERKTRYPADSWGFTDLEIGQGSVWMRRLFLRSDVESKLTSVAVHELTHVVLADRFCHRQIPRWADEGIALNSEPPQRQRDQRAWLAAEIRQGRGLTLNQLLNMQQYPGDRHMGDLFYAQSGSLIEFLLLQQGGSAESVMRLVESAQGQPVVYGLPGVSVARLESDWKAWLLKSEAEPVQLARD